MVLVVLMSLPGDDESMFPLLCVCGIIWHINGFYVFLVFRIELLAIIIVGIGLDLKAL